ncbi:hypothetical protein VSH64_31530 [Amycolatopsis rhabdoformis]|uniref:DUF3592 domain-containing protein n=1 Tax=Amycolatopsis rhabdoformis TaxID=1448059 RepID=A0ABZ1HZ17_9PSEU|nr:hypothetical protein [Amycolatopsis rhabdoformis]WSE27376.1 hypothetical protein VSH64_31530 [Amycolatopsis rhabdoformis]
MIWVRTVLVTLALVAVTWLGVGLNVFHRGGGTLLIWLSAALILVVPAILARSGVFVGLSVFVAGIHLVIVFMAGLAAVDGFVLETRGVQVQATATGYTDHWTAAQFTPPSKYTKHALAVVAPDGQHGIVATNGDKPGSLIPVIADPAAAVDLHRPDEVDFTVGLVCGLVDALMIFGWVYWAGRSRTRLRPSPGKAPAATE